MRSLIISTLKNVAFQMKYFLVIPFPYVLNVTNKDIALLLYVSLPCKTAFGPCVPSLSLSLSPGFLRCHDFQVDTESYKELEHWNEMLKNEAIKLCQENNFNTGFFEGSDNNTVVDAYELKVLHHKIVFRTNISESFNLFGIHIHRKHLLH